MVRLKVQIINTGPCNSQRSAGVRTVNESLIFVMVLDKPNAAAFSTKVALYSYTINADEEIIISSGNIIEV